MYFYFVPESDSNTSTPSHIRLSELAEQIRGVIHNAFHGRRFWVVAEISGHKFYKDSNRHYLELVEKMEGNTTETAKIRTTVWSEGAVKIKHFEQQTGQVFKDGLKVLVNVRVEYHIIYGLSLTLEDIDASYTLGDLQRRRLEILSRLVNESNGKITQVNGVFHTPNKLYRFNIALQKIALVASPNSEGLHDFMSNMLQNKHNYTFHIDQYFTSVQGASAEEELKRTMIRIYESGVQYDCVVIIRGGGAKTDFLAFDTFGIAMAVARFPVPVITGIGHFRDVSITDMMAHTSTNAPTKAAEFIIAHNRQFEENLLRFQNSIIIRSQQILSGLRQRMTRIHSGFIQNVMGEVLRKKNILNSHQAVLQSRSRTILYNKQNHLLRWVAKVSATPAASLRSHQRQTDLVSQQVRNFSLRYIQQQKQQIETKAALMKIIDPRNLLQKGFAIVKSEGKIIANASGVFPGAQLSVLMQNTELQVNVLTNKIIQSHEL